MLGNYGPVLPAMTFMNRATPMAFRPVSKGVTVATAGLVRVLN